MISTQAATLAGTLAVALGGRAPRSSCRYFAPYGTAGAVGAHSADFGLDHVERALDDGFGFVARDIAGAGPRQRSLLYAMTSDLDVLPPWSLVMPASRAWDAALEAATAAVAPAAAAVSYADDGYLGDADTRRRARARPLARALVLALRRVVDDDLLSPVDAARLPRICAATCVDFLVDGDLWPAADAPRVPDPDHEGSDGEYCETCLWHASRRWGLELHARLEDAIRRPVAYTGDDEAFFPDDSDDSDAASDASSDADSRAASAADGSDAASSDVDRSDDDALADASSLPDLDAEVDAAYECLGDDAADVAVAVRVATRASSDAWHPRPTRGGGGGRKRRWDAARRRWVDVAPPEPLERLSAAIRARPGRVAPAENARRADEARLVWLQGAPDRCAFFRNAKRDAYDVARVVAVKVARSKFKTGAGFDRRCAIRAGDAYCQVQWLEAHGAPVAPNDRRRAGLALVDHALWPQPPPPRKKRRAR